MPGAGAKADEDVAVIPAFDADDQSATDGERSSGGWQRWALAALVAVVLVLIWEMRRWSWGGDGEYIQLYVVVPLLEVILGVLSRSVLSGPGRHGDEHLQRPAHPVGLWC